MFWIACVLSLLACGISLLMIELPLQDKAPVTGRGPGPQVQPAE